MIPQVDLNMIFSSIYWIVTTDIKKKKKKEKKKIMVLIAYGVKNKCPHLLHAVAIFLLSKLSKLAKKKLNKTIQFLFNMGNGVGISKSIYSIMFAI